MTPEGVVEIGDAHRSTDGSQKTRHLLGPIVVIGASRSFESWALRLSAHRAELAPRVRRFDARPPLPRDDYRSLRVEPRHRADAPAAQVAPHWTDYIACEDAGRREVRKCPAREHDGQPQERSDVALHGEER